MGKIGFLRSFIRTKNVERPPLSIRLLLNTISIRFKNVFETNSRVDNFSRNFCCRNTFGTEHDVENRVYNVDVQRRLFFSSRLKVLTTRSEFAEFRTNSPIATRFLCSFWSLRLKNASALNRSGGKKVISFRTIVRTFSRRIVSSKAFVA